MLMQPVQGRERHEILKKRERKRENMFTALSAIPAYGAQYDI